MYIIIIIMVSKICSVVVKDQYAEKELSPNTLHRGPSPSIISKRQLQVSSTIVKYTGARLGDLFKERHKIIHTISVKSHDKLLRLSRLRA